jgi:hypothetical protein
VRATYGRKRRRSFYSRRSRNDPHFRHEFAARSAREVAQEVQPSCHRNGASIGPSETDGARKPAWQCGFLNFCYTREKRWRSEPVVPQGFQRSVLQTLLSCIAVFSSLIRLFQPIEPSERELSTTDARQIGCVSHDAVGKAVQGHKPNAVLTSVPEHAETARRHRSERNRSGE